MNSSNWNSRAVSSIFLPLRSDPAGHPVEFQVGQFQLGIGFRVAGLAAPGQRVDARQQLRHVVWLGQIIIAAGAQARDAVVHVAEGAQNQHRHLAPGGAQRLHQGETVELRQHAIDDRQIDGDRGCHVQPLQAVARDIDRVSGLAQRLRQVVARNFVIFNYQDVHGWVSYRR